MTRASQCRTEEGEHSTVYFATESFLDFDDPLELQHANGPVVERKCHGIPKELVPARLLVESSEEIESSISGA